MQDVRAERVAVRPDLELAVDRRDGGDAAPFLLVHGLASNARLWDGVAEELAAVGHPVVAVDQRGHGRSGGPEGGYDTPTAAEDLRLLLETLGWERPVLVGQSWGGVVVLELARSHPELVAGVATVDGGITDLPARFDGDWDRCREALTPPDLSELTLATLRDEVTKLHSDWSDRAVDAVLASFRVLDDGTVRPVLTLDRHLSIVRSMWDRPPSTVLPEVRVPVLLIPADEGSDWSSGRRREAAAAETAIPTVRVRWLDGDHDLHAQRPADVARLLHEATVDGFFA